MRGLIFSFIITITGISFAQNPDGFDKMCKNYIKGTVKLANPQQLKFEISKNPNTYILDAREENEYNISHIKGARLIGFNDFEIESIQDISKEAKVFVYCSIGYRSEKIGEKLKKDGFTSIYNLYGGIFNWVNSGYPIENTKGQVTNAVHGYNKKWSKWLNEEKCEKRLN